MAEQIIDVGTAPNNGTGDPLRTAFIKTDNNFDQIWAAGPVGSNVRIQNNVVSTLQVNQDLALSPNGVGNVRLNNNTIPGANNTWFLGSTTNQWRGVYANSITAGNVTINNNLVVPGDVTIEGNLTVEGDTIQIGNIVTDTKTIQLSNTASTANAATGSGITVGANDNIATLLYNSASNVWATNIGITATGNVTAPYFIGNGALLTGIISYSNANATSLMASFGSNTISTTGNITAGYFVGNGSLLTGLAATYGNANVVANLAALGSNPISTTGNVTGNYFVGNGSQLTGIVSSYGNANVANYLPTFSGNISAGNISASGNISGAYIKGNGSELTNLPAPVVTQDISSTGDMSIMTYDGVIKSVNYATVEPSTGTIKGGNIFTLGNVTGGNINSPTLNNSGNINVVAGGNTWIFGSDGRLINLDGLTLTAGGQFNICTILTGGSGYDTGSALKATTGGSGTGMTVGIGYGLSTQLTNVGVVDPGTGYVDGDVITVSEGTGGTFVITQYNEQANQANNNFIQSDWTFGADGNLTIPNDIVSNTTIDIDNRASGNGADIRLFAADDITLQARDRSAGSTTEGGDINIFAGDSAEDSDTSAGDIVIEAGRGGASNIDFGGSGGFVRVEAGDGGDAIGANFSARPGGSLTLNAGHAGSNNGNIDLGAAGANVYIGAGDSTGNGVNGGTIYLTSGAADASALAGDVVIQAGGTWTFDNTGNLALPQGGVVYETNIPDGGLNGKTIALKPQGGTDADQQLLIYPTVNDANHLHLTTGNLYNTELFLGDDNLYVKLANTGNVVVNSNDDAGNTAQWIFGTDGIATLPGEGVLQSLNDTVTLRSLNTTTGNANSVYLGSSGGLGFNDQEIGGNWLEIFRNGAEPEIRVPVGRGNLNIQTAEGANVYNWLFNNTGNLTLPTDGYLVVTTGIIGSGASPAPSLSGFSSVSAITVTATGNISAVGNITSGNLTVGSGTVNGGNFNGANFNGNVAFGTGTVGGSGNITGGNISAIRNISGGNLSLSGNISGNTAGFAIGYRDIPQVAFTANATLAATDAGKHYYSTLATANTLTIANNTSVSWVVGTAITVVNRGSGNITVAQGTGVSLYLAGNSSAANRTVSTYGMATLLNVAANVWMINGTGVS